MGLFSKIFGGSGAKKESVSKVNWNALTDLSQLDEIVEESKEKAIVIFKHSTSCGISRMVLSGFERDFDSSNDELKLYYLDILNYRELSNQIAAGFGIWHESPQLLIIKEEKVIYHASHGEIDAKKIENYK